MKQGFVVILQVLFFSGCVILKLPVETVKLAGTVVKTTGRVVEAVGTGVVTTVGAAGKCVEASGGAAQAAVKTPGTTEVVAAVINTQK